MELNGIQVAAVVQTPKTNGMRQNDGEQEKRNSQINDIEKAALPISEKTVINSIQKVNKALEKFAQTVLEFSVHEKTHTIMVKVIDRDTKEVIREIPPEKIEDMIAKLMELSGIFIDERR